MRILLTCEHGGNKIPKKYQSAFARIEKALESHRGLDIGALGVAKRIARSLRSSLLYSETSRLLVDLNRSMGHESQFSEVSSQFSEIEKENILKRYYFPHHVRVQTEVQRDIANAVLHLGIHSFTPKMNGVIRTADIGILFDPRSRAEKDFAEKLRNQLRKIAPHLKVKMNYPYRGTSDGLTTSLRSAFGKSKYAGIEIELNQKFFKAHIGENQKLFADLLSKAIKGIII